MSEQNGLKLLQKNRDDILLFEISALIHDLGKLSKEFVGGNSNKSTQPPDLVNIRHNLILQRLIHGEDPYCGGARTIADALRCYQITPYITSVQGDILREMFNGSYNTADTAIGNSLAQAAEQVVGTDYKSNSDYEALRKFSSQIRREKRIPSDFWNTNSEKLRQLISKELGVSLELNSGKRLELKAIGDILEQHHKVWHEEIKDLDNAVLIMRADKDGCDGVDSGIDKGAVAQSVSQQDYDDTFISSAFGYEPAEQKIDLSALGCIRNKYAQKLGDILAKIKEKRQNHEAITPCEWESFLSCPGIKSLSCPGGIRRITENAFRKGLGETRRAANDVTLWDHSFSVASLYKAAVVKCLLDKKFEQPEKIHWRILRISFDGLGFIQKSHRIPDILGRRSFLHDTIDKIKTVLEIEYPLGNEIYRDENGSAFLVPALKCDDNGNKIEGLVQEALKLSPHKTAFEGELLPQLRLSAPSRTAVELGKLLAETLEPQQPSVKKVKKWWCGQNEELCTVCQLRPMGHGAPNKDKYKKAEDRSVCHTCLERRGRRSQEWATKELDTTIWVDEVADENGRVALVVGKFDLSHWLDGWWLNSTLVQSLHDWQNSSKANANKKYPDMVNALKDSLEKDENRILNQIAHDAYRPYRDKSVEDFYKAIVKERDVHELTKYAQEEDFEKGLAGDMEKHAEIFGLLLMRKHPSFARLRRIWETTRNFWRDVNEKLIPEVVQPVQFRLEINGDVSTDLGDYHAYDTRVGNVDTSLVWDSCNNKFISADNLRYVAKLLELEECNFDAEQLEVNALRKRLKERGCLNIYEQPGTGKHPEKKATIKNLDVNVVCHNYRPFISILEEPQVYLGLVPADKAIEVVDAMRREYEVQFSKVRNRLPLHLSIVFFNRRLPVYVAIDAARRMLNRKSNLEVWRVKDKPKVIQTTNGAHSAPRLEMKVKLIPQCEEGDGIDKEIDKTISYSCGQPDVLDYYHPYFHVEKLSDDKDETQREYRFKSPLPQEKCKPVEFKHLLHVSELVQGDEVYVMPSSFDFEFLDVAGRRFEINYTNNGRRPRATRPYLLEDIRKIKRIWDIIGGANGLTPTQISQVEGFIETHRTDWFSGNEALEWMNDKTFAKFVEATLLRAGEGWWAKLSADEQTLLRKWAVNGRLTDVLELFMKIVKEEPIKRG